MTQRSVDTLPHKGHKRMVSIGAGPSLLAKGVSLLNHLVYINAQKHNNKNW